MFVVDSSFAIADLLPEEHTAFALAVRGELDRTGRAAPALLAFEVANVLWRKLRRAEITVADRESALRDFAVLSYELETPPDLPVQLSIARLADRHGLSAYDAAYLEMAVRRGAVLVSLDRNLAQAGRAERLDVRSPYA